MRQRHHQSSKNLLMVNFSLLFIELGDPKIVKTFLGSPIKEEVMPTRNDIQFKELVLSNNLVKPKEMEECMMTLSSYEGAGVKKSLSTILLEKGYMSLKQIHAIQQLQGNKEEHIIPGYTIMETVGQGGLGIVYKAQQESLGRVVALKVMYPHFTNTPQYLQRFIREAKVSAELEHPNIVKGIDFGEAEGLFYFAMEFVDGFTIKQIVKSRGRLTELESVNIIFQVAEALNYAEQRNIIHRDIKPENIMLTQNGVPKLCDLGLTKAMDTDMSLTQTGIVVGTPHYISPEQAMGEKDLDIRSDIYSLGVTFYHMLTGDLPYHGDSVISIINQHITSEVPCPREKNPEVSPEISRIICKMMAKKRDDRYASTVNLLHDLARIFRSS